MADAHSWAFKRFTQVEGGGSERHYFVMSKFHEDPEDFEASTFDVTVVSGQKSWSGTGLKKPSTRHTQALQKIYLALGPNQQTKTTFNIRFAEEQQNLKVVCQWKDEGNIAFLSHQPLELTMDRHDGAAGTLIFDTLLSKCEELQAAGSRDSSSYAAFKQEAEAAQRQLKVFVSSQAEREEQLHLAVARLLAGKKRRIRDLEAQLEQLRQQQEGQAEQTEQANEAAHSAETEYSTQPSDEHETLSQGTRMDADSEPMDDEKTKQDGDEASSKTKPRKPQRGAKRAASGRKKT